MKTAVIYARYSSDNQTEQSIEGQIHVCEEYAKQHDILIVDTYIDRAMTGTNDNRPDFQRMLKDSNKKQWDYVLVYKFDRFSRNKYETTIHKHALANNGIKLLSAMENIPDTPEGIILESLLEGMNQYYSAELSQKVKRGMNETRLKGNFTGGCILYGYKVENHKVIIEDEEAENVKYIFKQYSLGIFAKDIVEELNQKHIYNRGKPFTTSSIYHMLKNEKYSGIYKFQNEIYDNIFPRIVPYETYNIVQKKIEVNKYGKKSNEVIYLLKGKLFCGHCGCPINGECGYSKTGAKNRYYKCNGRKKKNGCTKTMIRKEILEDFLINAVLEIINKPKYIDEIVNQLLQIQEKNANKNSRLSILLKDKKQNENNLNNMIKAVEQGLVSKTIIERMKILEEEQSNLEKEIIIEQLKAKTKLTYDQILEYFLQALKMNPLLLVGYLIKEVKAYDDKIEIIYNNPINNAPDDKSQGFLFYSKTKKMKKTVLYKTDKNYIDILLNMYI